MNNYALGIELGSTRIKATIIDDNFKVISSGDYTWKSTFENGIWTYDLNEALIGLKEAIKQLDYKEDIKAMGVSGMMHGYLAFDSDWNLLVPFRTWQNTITARASKELTELFKFNIPQRWSIAHLYEAILNNEEHVSKIAHITTLAGYIHYMLTGVNALGIGEASGMFPIDSKTNNYNEEMLDKFNNLLKEKNINLNIKDILPNVLLAGHSGGYLTNKGCDILDNLLPPNILVCPCEGDAGTGMVATNSIAPRTGNVSAGTSIFSMVVLEKPLRNVHEEIDIVTTPTGKDVAMVHCNNCTNDSNAWVSVLKEVTKLFGEDISNNDIYTKLYEKSLEGESDCGGLLVCNYMAGEGVTHFNEGMPLVVRKPSSNFSLANFFKASLYSTMSTLKIGMDILNKEEVKIDSLMGHGGLFKTPVVGQRYLAGACNTSVTCMETAGEGGPYGMALLAKYMLDKKDNESLDDYLNNKVFKTAKKSTFKPLKEDVDDFNKYIKDYQKLLEVERKAIEVLGGNNNEI